MAAGGIVILQDFFIPPQRQFNCVICEVPRGWCTTKFIRLCASVTKSFEDFKGTKSDDGLVRQINLCSDCVNAIALCRTMKVFVFCV